MAAFWASRPIAFRLRGLAGRQRTPFEPGLMGRIFPPTALISLMKIAEMRDQGDSSPALALVFLIRNERYQ
jgi:hypothetical protein